MIIGLTQLINHGWWGGCMVDAWWMHGGHVLYRYYILVENSPYSWMRRGIVSSLEENKIFG